MFKPDPGEAGLAQEANDLHTHVQDEFFGLNPGSGKLVLPV